MIPGCPLKILNSDCLIGRVIQRPLQWSTVFRLAPYSYLLNTIELLWSVLKSNVQRLLRERMPEVLAIQPVGPTFIADQSMNVLEDVARMSIRNLSSMMLGLFHRVEKYYGISTRQENLVELS